MSNDFTSSKVVSSKNHFIYFKGYLGDGGLKARTIVVEEDYVSKDFLQDYASYYAFCFEKYPKFCNRVHFFSNEFDLETFQGIITENESRNEEFWSKYLGFVVVKPIPTKFIGYTVLKTYESGMAFESRNFWGVREYEIHLFGNKVRIASLAFQEQDSVLAACATTAIWSMLNKASIDFHTVLKSPSQITKDADNVSPDGSRLFPNKGLNLLQICQAIFNSGLVSEVKQADYQVRDIHGNILRNCITGLYMKKILNAYSPVGIPLIFVISVPNNGGYGLHAIAVSGFKQSAPKLIPPTTDVSWLASNIEKFYAHDDQWGPFARIDFLNDFEIETPWTTFASGKPPTYVTNIVVPIYPKVRISYEDIEVIVLGLDTILTLFFNGNIVADLVWNIQIDYSENFKNGLKTSNLDRDEILSRLINSMPKYLWIASCYIADFKVIEFTFDATNVNNGMFGEDVICYLEPEIRDKLHEFLEGNHELLKSLFKHAATESYYDFISSQLKNPTSIA
ncbi:hypothetical protein [Algoriphagus sp. Y33]|uniref:hypothetical protein n=1 Tax=Algoriphagus sp. Y33 TaxID=2772483 RepID=UPI001780AC22|nr:hypothetical protein [Algoriphagus sp. Y33]